MIEKVLREAVEAGATQLRHYFDKTNLQTSYKAGGANDLVTEADHASDRAIIATIKNAFPDHFILSEETGNMETGSATKWIIDPIDGTINYAQGIPICCVSIGVEHDGKMVMGAVYNPFMNEMFFAEKNNRATLNDVEIRVSQREALIKSCLVTGFPYTYVNEENGPLQVFDRLIRKGVPVRRLGSAAIDLCWVACGRFDGFYEHKLNAWDSAAGYLIVEEAGGKVTNLNGDDYSPYQPGIIASNAIIHQELIEVVKGTHPDF